MQEWDAGRWLRGRLAWESVLERLRTEQGPADPTERIGDRVALSARFARSQTGLHAVGLPQHGTAA